MSYTVFIIEDDKTSRVLITSILKKMGVTKIISSINGENALEKLKHQKPDLIICDWYMPVMSGLDFYRKAKNGGALKGVPFLMVTSEGKKERIMDALKSGIRNYMVKPVSPDVFKDKVKGLLPN